MPAFDANKTTPAAAGLAVLLSATAPASAVDPAAIAAWLMPPTCQGIQAEMRQRILTPSEVGKDLVLGLVSLEQAFKAKQDVDCDLTSLSTLNWAFGFTTAAQLSFIRLGLTDSEIKHWQRENGVVVPEPVRAPWLREAAEPEPAAVQPEPEPAPLEWHSRSTFGDFTPLGGTDSTRLDAAKDACGRGGDATYFRCMNERGYYWRAVQPPRDARSAFVHSLTGG